MTGEARFFQTLNYSSQNEDWRTESEALALVDGGQLLAITGSGDRALNPLAHADVHVTAIDMAPAQNHLLHVKIAAMRQLDYADYVAFIGLHEAPRPARMRWAAALDVPPSTRRWLAAHPRDVGAGLLYRGRFERWFARVAQVGRLLKGPAIDELLRFDDLEAQRRFVADRWDTPGWRAAWVILCHPLISRSFFGDPAFFPPGHGPVGATLFDRIRAGLDHVLARESFMVHLILTGRLSPHDLPPYLTEEGVAAIRPRLDQIQVVDGDVVDALAAARGRFDALSLSDTPSYLDPVALDTLLVHARQATRSEGRIVIRQFLTDYSPDTPQGLSRLRTLERDLAARDRTFNYTFLIYEVDRGEVDLDRLVIEPYTAADSDACSAIERRSPQGRGVQLSFRRPTYHRRAENFVDHELLVARLDGRIVAVTAVAFKDVVLLGRTLRAAFYFDLRVDPELRRHGVAARIAGASAARAEARSDLGYCFAMDDNRAMQAMTRLFGSWDVAGYRYLVLPTNRVRLPTRPVQPSTLSAVHESMLDVAPPFELYTDPRVGGSTAGHVSSWTVDTPMGRGGASAWDNSQILAEVVERLPWSLRAARTALRWMPVNGPHIPRAGEQLRSWYLFDVHGTTPDVVVDVVRQVSADARDAGIDFLYVPWVAGDEAWVGALRAGVPRVFRTEIPYRLLVGRPLAERPSLSRFYVDVRDL